MQKALQRSVLDARLTLLKFILRYTQEIFLVLAIIVAGAILFRPKAVTLPAETYTVNAAPFVPDEYHGSDLLAECSGEWRGDHADGWRTLQTMLPNSAADSYRKDLTLVMVLTADELASAQSVWQSLEAHLGDASSSETERGGSTGGPGARIVELLLVTPDEHVPAVTAAAATAFTSFAAPVRVMRDSALLVGHDGIYSALPRQATARILRLMVAWYVRTEFYALLSPAAVLKQDSSVAGLVTAAGIAVTVPSQQQLLQQQSAEAAAAAQYLWRESAAILGIEHSTCAQEVISAAAGGQGAPSLPLLPSGGEAAQAPVLLSRSLVAHTICALTARRGRISWLRHLYSTVIRNAGPPAAGGAGGGELAAPWTDRSLYFLSTHCSSTVRDAALAAKAEAAAQAKAYGGNTATATATATSAAAASSTAGGSGSRFGSQRSLFDRYHSWQQAGSPSAAAVDTTFLRLCSTQGEGEQQQPCGFTPA